MKRILIITAILFSFSTPALAQLATSTTDAMIIASSTQQAQDQQNLFNGVLLFMLSTGFVVWLFRK